MSDKNNYILAERPSVELQMVEAMVDDLEAYIVRDDVYRTILMPTSAGNLNLRMSGGDLLARLHRLQGERDQLTPEEQQRLDAVQQKADQVIYSLRTRFLQRLEREMKARLDSLKWFLDEWDRDSQRGRGEFPFEMRNRQRIEEILKQFAGTVPEGLQSALSTIDRRIRQHTQGSDFIWDNRLEAVYPREKYWYLYRK